MISNISSKYNVPELKEIALVHHIISKPRILDFVSPRIFKYSHAPEFLKIASFPYGTFFPYFRIEDIEYVEKK